LYKNYFSEGGIVMANFDRKQEIPAKTFKFCLIFFIVTLFSTYFVSNVEAGPDGPPGLQVVQSLGHGITPPIRQVPPLPPKTGPKHQIPKYAIPHAQIISHIVDPALQSSSGPLVSAIPTIGFEGLDDVIQSDVSGSLVAPPDTNGAAGDTQYVQWVNLAFAVFDKTTGAMTYGPAAGNTLWSIWSGSPNAAEAACAANNSGDPIAQYDKAAGRWVMMQPVFTSPYYLCVAVSTTSDATGSYNLYVFPIQRIGTRKPQTVFPDYPKLGVWPDAYYVSYNQFQGNTFVGPAACAMDRNAMLNGGNASMQCFSPGSSYGSLLPSDLDGLTAPPAGSPDYFMSLANNSLDLWKFHVDFNNPGNSAFTGPVNIPVAAFSEACGGGVCIPQLGTTQQLDSLGDRLMYRLAYRNFGDHESLVVNHSVNTGTGNTGIRWYEIRNPESPVLYQQGTFAPDPNFRWMGSVAMDKMGDMALGYSVSSSTMNPAIRYAGRVPGDTPGTMQSEANIIEGIGSQTNNLNRWGDYSSISIDPVDDCTFWYTNEYLDSYGTFNWNTRVASFKFSSCSTSPDFSISATPFSQTVIQGSNAGYQVNVTALNGFTGTVSLSVTGVPDSSAGFSPSSVTGSGASTLTVDTSSLAPGTYTLTITGTSGSLNHSTSVALTVSSQSPADFSISAAPSSQTVTRPQNASYDVTVTALNAFTGTVNFSVSGLPPHSSASFNPASVSGSGSSTLTVKTNKKTYAGPFTLTITGTSGSLTHSTTVELDVQ
jgi:hypothetical protein